MVEVVVSSLLVGLVLVSALSSVGSVTESWTVAEQRTDGVVRR